MSNGPYHLQPVETSIKGAGSDLILPDIVSNKSLPKEPVAIAEMAEYFGVTHRTLHFYEEKGLIQASRFGLMRVYGQSDVARMALINVCRELGMPISVIQDLFEMLATVGSKSEANLLLEEALMARRRELAANLSTVHRQLQQINGLLDQEQLVGNRASADMKPPHLSDMEQRCLQLMAEGYTATRIARTLELKAQEVDDIERAIIAKVGALNRFQAVAKAVLLGIVVN